MANRTDFPKIQIRHFHAFDDHGLCHHQHSHTTQDSGKVFTFYINRFKENANTVQKDAMINCNSSKLGLDVQFTDSPSKEADTITILPSSGGIFCKLNSK